MIASDGIKDQRDSDESNRPTPSGDQETQTQPEKDTAKTATKKSEIPVKKHSSSSKLLARHGKDERFVQSESEEKAMQVSAMKGDSQNSARVEPKGKSKRISGVSSAASSEKGVSRTSSANDLETGSWNNIKVVVRVRPLNASELHREEKASIEYPEKGVIWVNAQSNTKPFTFNSIFEEKVSQAQIFEQCGIKELLEKALDGFSCTAFAFGQTGSGKTYTITGPFNPDASDILPTQSLFGLLPRSFEHLVSEVEKREESYVVKASYLEVYNEKVKDLLNPSRARDSLPVRWSSSSGFYVENIFMMECQTVEDMMAVLEEGLQNRQVGAHAMNDYSSRSHTMLTVYLDSEFNDPEDALPVMKHGKISFVDLAGSERVKETKPTGGALTESQNINKSLLTLGNCIAALGDPKKRGGHIPYRESKLTMLLADSIGGEGYTLMIACISPSSSTMQDTLNTLRYANRAKNIKNKPVVKMDPREQLIISMKREMKLLKAENAYFRQQLNIPCSDSQMVITPSQIQGVMSADETSGILSPAIGTDTLSSLHSSSRNSLAEVKSEESIPRATTAMYAMTASIGLYDMLQEYINENESLRQQNTELFKGRKEVEKDYEMLSMKNESLMQKLGNIERALSSTSLSTRSDSDETITGNGNIRRRSLIEFRGEPQFNLSFPPLRSGTYPNIVSTDVDLSLEFEMERNKLKEERERKKREEMKHNEESKEVMGNQSTDKMRKPDMNQNWVGVKPEEAQAVGNPKSKNQDQTTVSVKNSNEKADQAAPKMLKAHFKFKSPKRKTMPEREKSINSYAAKFAVRKGLTSQHQQQVKEPEVHDNNIEQWNSVAESNTFQAQLSDQSQSHIGHNARLDLNNAYLMNDQLRKELDQLEGQIQKEFAFKQTKKPKYHGR